MSESHDATTVEPQSSTTVPPAATAATPPADTPAAPAADAERLKLEKAEADLVTERVRSTIATQLLTSDTRLANPNAFGVVEHLVAQKVAAGIEISAAVGAVLTEHPYLKAAPPAAAVVEPPATTGVSPGASGTVSPATLRPAPVRDALTMSTAEWAAHRRELGA